ncbi:MAG: glycosyltransferase family 39 protein [Anaerolineae bacterium]|nr:glycosyltransferase family 39 protein [Anaerolineae bacterium]
MNHTRRLPAFSGTALWLPLAVVLLAAALRLFGLGAQSYWVDEITMLQVTAGDWTGVLREFELSAGKLIGRPPLYTLLGYGWTQVFGTNAVTVRLLSALASIVSTALLYRIGRDLFGRTVGLVGALLMAVSMYQLHYAQEHRYYGVLLLVTLSCITFYLRAVKTGRRRDFVLFAIFGIVIFYAHPLGMFVLVAPGLHFLLCHWRKDRALRVPWVVSQVVILIGAGAWLVVQYLSQFGAGGDAETALAVPTEWIPIPPLRAPLRTALNFLVLDHELYFGLVSVVVAALVLVAGTVIYGLWRRRTYAAGLRQAGGDLAALWRERRSGLILAGLWLVVPLVMFFGAARFGQPIYLDRYMIGVSPALYLWIGVAALALRRIVPVAVLLLAILVPVLAPLPLYYTGATGEQWREAAAYVEAHAAPQDALAFGADIGRLGDIITARDSFAWYYPGDVSTCYVSADQESDRIAGELAACATPPGHLWYVVRNYDQARMDAWRAFLADSPAGGLHFIGMQTFTGITVYELDVPQ